MKKILVVDDEKTFRDSLVSAIKAADDQFDITSAENGKKAAKLLESESFDLVITDLKMPEMDGFELLAFMNSHFPSTPVAVMSAFGTPETRTKISAFSPLGFLNKPFKLEELLKVIDEGIAKSASVHGSLVGISLINFLQLIEMEKKSCLLEVRGRGERGYIYCSNGELYDAFFEDLKSEEAVIEMLSLKKVDISFKNLPKKRILKRINKNIISLIMDAEGNGGKSAAKQKVEGKNKEAALEGQKTEPEDITEEVKASTSEEEPVEEIEISGEEKATEVDFKKIDEIIEALKKDLGEGLITINFFGTVDGKSIGNYNSEIGTSELFNRITGYLKVELESGGYSGLGEYYVMNLTDGKLVLIILLGNFSCQVTVDGGKIDSGHLLKGVIPMIIDSFFEASNE
ncbi:response regulator [Thermodesulfobacteriota bacterium]